VTRREDETTRYLREIRNSVRFIAWAIGITIGLSMAIGIVYAVIITR
jgi:ABC-type lipoprotein release transport system permease subunit